MINDDTGLARDLREGETVILSSGSAAKARRSYPAGYAGDVEIELDGQNERERASGLTLTGEAPPPSGFEP